MAIITQDGNYTVKLYNSNGSVISDNYKLSQIIADLIASGYDCNALTLHQYSSYGYGSLMAFKVTETGLYYVGDNDLKSGLGSNATLFQKDNITFNQHYYTYTNGSLVDRGVISLGTQTINGLEYYYDYDGNVANEPIIYVDSSISLVVNDMLSPSGGAGSGYIGNSLLSNKKMVGYNVHTSSEESTKTESVNEASESPVSGKPKIGNGYARIKFLRSCWGGEEVTILWAGNSNKMTVQISNSDILFKLYTGDIAIYSFTAYAGSTVLDADNIYVHFLIESEQQLAKPSMVYANGSVLSYNQEEPTDAEMADIYTWLSAGLPSV